MKLITNRRLFRKDDSPQAIFDTFFETAIGLSLVLSLARIVTAVFFIHMPLSIMFVDTVYTLVLISGFFLRRSLTPWIKEMLLLGISFFLTFSFYFFLSFSNVSALLYSHNMVFQINRFVLLLNILILSSGGIVKLYRTVTRTRQVCSLTGLGNLRWMQLYVDKRIEGGVQDGVLVLVNIRNFRMINSLYGRDYGDDLIRYAAEILINESEKGFKAAHISGMEFCLWMETKNHKELHRGFEHFRDLIIARSRDAGINANLIFVTSGASYPQDGSDFAQIYARTSMALEKTMACEQRSSFFYTPGIEDELKQENIFEYEIQRALRLDEFYMAYQAKYDLDGRLIHGFEALARWNSPSLGKVSPELFIPVIHRLNLSIPFTKLVIQKVIEDIPRIDSMYGGHKRISINIPPNFFQFSDAVPFVREILIETGVSAERLTFEITEDLSIEGIAVVKQLVELKEMGIKISLDDFGKGYSSLSHLLKLPIQELKIDKCFIDDIHTCEKSFILVKAICEIAKANNFSVVAEGVENYAQVELLQQTSCEQIQGYIYSCPEPVSIQEFHMV